MPASITLLTSAGAVRVAGEGLVIDLRQFANAPEGPQLNDEPSPEVGPQAEASHVGTDTGMPADREGRRDGEAASVDLPTIPETPATSSQPVTAPGRMTSSPSVRVPHSAPSKAEAGRAGGPVCAPVTHQENSLEREPETGTAIFPASVSSSVGARQAADPKTSDWKQDRAPKSSDPRDPGPIPSFMDRRKQKELACG